MDKLFTQFNRIRSIPALETLRHCKSLLKTAMLGVCLVPLLASDASAAVLTGVQFRNTQGSDYTGTGVLGELFYHDVDNTSNYGSNGSIYNANNPFSLGDGVTVTVSGFTTGSLTGFQSVSGTAANLYSSFLLTNNRINTITIGGLTAGATYKLAIYGGITGDIGGQPTTIGGSFVSGSLNIQSATPVATFTNTGSGNNYLIFNSVIANGSGQISFTHTAPTGRQYSTLSGVGVESVVPEPSTIALVGLSFFGVMALRRRRRI